LNVAKLSQLNISKHFSRYSEKPLQPPLCHREPYQQMVLLRTRQLKRQQVQMLDPELEVWYLVMTNLLRAAEASRLFRPLIRDSSSII
jgi:hypothetical protein